eukprot:CAMPEP_0113297978 /NCGR_PEP_ID=MMETSP0010_2-20120614/613_1 /TAXON_ID=216773 ORGANISM="Corethron hystrix, Strain 308" /NCGR_SAMPLE_ID=MMETSP0010_2 /ASSEMBLY_ACC=CAM_ASM_000155 /LENGTH=149 /DNA_ID=CAMNT_0000150953 /DNA_START=292 /DNA_END=739 /DNA_ORIENTATION=- /assembly_acc=CAM_ASM_000155
MARDEVGFFPGVKSGIGRAPQKVPQGVQMQLRPLVPKERQPGHIGMLFFLQKTPQNFIFHGLVHAVHDIYPQISISPPSLANCRAASTSSLLGSGSGLGSAVTFEGGLSRLSLLPSLSLAFSVSLSLSLLANGPLGIQNRSAPPRPHVS